MSMPNLVTESVDTSRVSTFFIWKRVYHSFSTAFLQETYSLGNGTKLQAIDYLDELKRYSLNCIDDHADYWKTLSEMLELVEINGAIDVLRDLYKNVAIFDTRVNDMLLKLNMKPNIVETSFKDLRLYEFQDELNASRNKFKADYDEVLMYTQAQLFRTLPRSDMELRLLNDVNRQFQALQTKIEPQIMAMSSAENGDMVRFDLTYAVYQTEMYDLIDDIDRFKTVSALVADDELNSAIYNVRLCVEQLVRLGQTIANQPSYSIEMFKSGRMGSDVYAIVQEINLGTKTLRLKFSEFEDRIVELMAII